MKAFHSSNSNRSFLSTSKYVKKKNIKRDCIMKEKKKWKKEEHKRLLLIRKNYKPFCTHHIFSRKNNIKLKDEKGRKVSIKNKNIFENDTYAIKYVYHKKWNNRFVHLLCSRKKDSKKKKDNRNISYAENIRMTFYNKSNKGRYNFGENKLCMVNSLKGNPFINISNFSEKVQKKNSIATFMEEIKIQDNQSNFKKEQEKKNAHYKKKSMYKNCQCLNVYEENKYYNIAPCKNIYPQNCSKHLLVKKKGENWVNDESNLHINENVPHHLKKLQYNERTSYNCSSEESNYAKNKEHTKYGRIQRDKRKLNKLNKEDHHAGRNVKIIVTSTNHNKLNNVNIGFKKEKKRNITENYAVNLNDEKSYINKVLLTNNLIRNRNMINLNHINVQNYPVSKNIKPRNKKETTNYHIKNNKSEKRKRGRGQKRKYSKLNNKNFFVNKKRLIEHMTKNAVPLRKTKKVQIFNEPKYTSHYCLFVPKCTEHHRNDFKGIYHSIKTKLESNEKTKHTHGCNVQISKNYKMMKIIKNSFPVLPSEKWEHNEDKRESQNYIIEKMNFHKECTIPSNGLKNMKEENTTTGKKNAQKKSIKNGEKKTNLTKEPILLDEKIFKNSNKRIGKITDDNNINEKQNVPTQLKKVVISSSFKESITSILNGKNDDEKSNGRIIKRQNDLIKKEQNENGPKKKTFQTVHPDNLKKKDITKQMIVKKNEKQKNYSTDHKEKPTSKVNMMCKTSEPKQKSKALYMPPPTGNANFKKTPELNIKLGIHLSEFHNSKTVVKNGKDSIQNGSLNKDVIINQLGNTDRRNEGDASNKKHEEETKRIGYLKNDKDGYTNNTGMRQLSIVSRNISPNTQLSKIENTKTDFHLNKCVNSQVGETNKKGITNIVEKKTNKSVIKMKKKVQEYLGKRKDTIKQEPKRKEAQEDKKNNSAHTPHFTENESNIQIGLNLKKCKTIMKENIYSKEENDDNNLHTKDQKSNSIKTEYASSISSPINNSSDDNNNICKKRKPGESAKKLDQPRSQESLLYELINTNDNKNRIKSFLKNSEEVKETEKEEEEEEKKGNKKEESALTTSKLIQNGKNICLTNDENKNENKTMHTQRREKVCAANTRKNAQKSGVIRTIPHRGKSANTMKIKQVELATPPGCNSTEGWNNKSTNGKRKQRESAKKMVQPKSQESLLYELINTNDNKKRIKSFLKKSEEVEKTKRDQNEENTFPTNELIKNEKKKKFPKSSVHTSIIMKQNKLSNQTTQNERDVCSQKKNIGDKLSRKSYNWEGGNSDMREKKNEMKINKGKHAKGDDSLIYDLIDKRCNKIKIKNFVEQFKKYERSICQMKDKFNNYEKEKEGNNNTQNDKLRKNTIEFDELPKCNNGEKTQIIKTSPLPNTNSAKGGLCKMEIKAQTKEQNAKACKKICGQRVPPSIFLTNRADKCKGQNKMENALTRSQNKKETAEKNDNMQNNQIERKKKYMLKGEKDTNGREKNNKVGYYANKISSLNNTSKKIEDNKKKQNIIPKKEEMIKPKLFLLNNKPKQNHCLKIVTPLRKKHANDKEKDETKKNIPIKNLPIIRKRINGLKHPAEFIHLISTPQGVIPKKAIPKEDIPEKATPTRKDNFHNSQKKDIPSNDVQKITDVRTPSNNFLTEKKGKENLTYEQKIVGKNYFKIFLKYVKKEKKSRNNSKKERNKIKIRRNIDIVKKQNHSISPKNYTKRKMKKLQNEKKNNKKYVTQIIVNLMKGKRHTEKDIKIDNNIDSNNHFPKILTLCCPKTQPNEKSSQQKGKLIAVLKKDNALILQQKTDKTILRNSKQNVPFHITRNKIFQKLGNVAKEKKKKHSLVSYILKRYVNEIWGKNMKIVQIRIKERETIKIFFNHVSKTKLNEEQIEKVRFYYKPKEGTIRKIQNYDTVKRGNNYTISKCLGKKNIMLKIVYNKTVTHTGKKETVVAKYCFSKKDRDTQNTQQILFIKKYLRKEDLNLKTYKLITHLEIKQPSQFKKKKLIREKKTYPSALAYFWGEYPKEWEKYIYNEKEEKQFKINILKKIYSEKGMKKELKSIHVLHTKVLLQEVIIEITYEGHEKRYMSPNKTVSRLAKLRVTMMFKMITRWSAWQTWKQLSEVITIRNGNKYHFGKYVEKNRKMTIVFKTENLKKRNVSIVTKQIIANPRCSELLDNTITRIVKEMRKKQLKKKKKSENSLGKIHLKEKWKKVLNNEMGKTIEEISVGEMKKKDLILKCICDVKKDMLMIEDLKIKDTNIMKSVQWQPNYAQTNLKKMKNDILVEKYLKYRTFNLDESTLMIKELTAESTRGNINEPEKGMLGNVSIVETVNTANAATSERAYGIAADTKEQITTDIEKEIITIKHLINEILLEMKNGAAKDLKIKKMKSTKREKPYHKKLIGNINIREFPMEYLTHSKEHMLTPQIKEEINRTEEIHNIKPHGIKKEQRNEKLKNDMVKKITDELSDETTNVVVITEDKWEKSLGEIKKECLTDEVTNDTLTVEYIDGNMNEIGKENTLDEVTNTLMIDDFDKENTIHILNHDASDNPTKDTPLVPELDVNTNAKIIKGNVMGDAQVEAMDKVVGDASMITELEDVYMNRREMGEALGDIASVLMVKNVKTECKKIKKNSIGQEIKKLIEMVNELKKEYIKEMERERLKEDMNNEMVMIHNMENEMYCEIKKGNLVEEFTKKTTEEENDERNMIKDESKQNLTLMENSPLQTKNEKEIMMLEDLKNENVEKTKDMVIVVENKKVMMIKNCEKDTFYKSKMEKIKNEKNLQKKKFTEERVKIKFKIMDIFKGTNLEGTKVEKKSKRKKKQNLKEIVKDILNEETMIRILKGTVTKRGEAERRKTKDIEAKHGKVQKVGTTGVEIHVGTTSKEIQNVGITEEEIHVGTTSKEIQNEGTTAEEIHNVDTTEEEIHSVDTAAEEIHNVDTTAEKIHVDTTAEKIHNVDTTAEKIHNVDSLNERAYTVEAKRNWSETIRRIKVYEDKREKECVVGEGGADEKGIQHDNKNEYSREGVEKNEKIKKLMRCKLVTLNESLAKKRAFVNAQKSMKKKLNDDFFCSCK
ncbi:conserved Plasmodium protein, unknown function [Plasmodium ovale]|uniref:Uncharacterized protein n=2 Tax=Plasmodium ovale TaxID=36330 RepID=A0A1A8VPA4_PLAOA|nr:conserved Plasmodium protein, unknown function [Plasmodium ovale curtisi]SCA48518.1 conserved Plasmodium protein, unknown function [Plasmodium ovale]